eukprot:scaffold18628_cov128-Skeletonema_marinoi.AAC.1
MAVHPIAKLIFIRIITAFVIFAIIISEKSLRFLFVRAAFTASSSDGYVLSDRERSDRTIIAARDQLRPRLQPRIGGLYDYPLRCVIAIIVRGGHSKCA